MARTLKGNLTGKARQTEKRDFQGSLEQKVNLTEREKLEIELNVANSFLTNLINFHPNPTKEAITKAEENIADITAKLAYGTNWEKDADALVKLKLNESNLFDEAKTHKCENCEAGYVWGASWNAVIDEIRCPCCDGNWQDCDNCRNMEGTGDNGVAHDARANMRGHL